MCRQRFPQSELLRVRRTAEGIPTLTHGVGRSAYACRTPACAQQITERGRIARAWRGPVTSVEFEQIRALVAPWASAALTDG